MVDIYIAKIFNRWLLAMHSKKPRLALISSVAIVGLIAEVFLSDGAFARAGAVLVVFAILLIYGGHTMDKQIEYFGSLQGDYGSYIQAKTELQHGEETNFEVESENDKGMKSFTLWNLPGNIESNRQRVWEYEHSNVVVPLLAQAKNRSKLIECTVGAAGTLIWGFGDLVPTLC